MVDHRSTRNTGLRARGSTDKHRSKIVGSENCGSGLADESENCGSGLADESENCGSGLADDGSEAIRSANVVHGSKVVPGSENNGSGLNLTDGTVGPGLTDGCGLKGDSVEYGSLEEALLAAKTEESDSSATDVDDINYSEMLCVSDADDERCNELNNGTDIDLKTEPSAAAAAAKSRWTCASCDFSTDHTGHFRRHMQRRHGDGVRSSQCPQCAKGFYCTDEMMRHVRKVHQRNFLCIECKEEFRTEYKLRKHLRLEHNATLDKLPCQHCPSKFVSTLLTVII